MTITKKAYERLTEDAQVEALSVTISDGIIALHSNDGQGKDMVRLMKDAINSLPDVFDPHWKTMRESSDQMKFFMKMEVDLLDEGKPESRVSTALYVVGSHNKTRHGIRNNVTVYDESEIKAMPEYANIKLE